MLELNVLDQTSSTTFLNFSFNLGTVIKKMMCIYVYANAEFTKCL